MLEADQRGQYAAGVLVNGAPVQMLIDTGASDVCISASTARRLGLSPSGGRKRVMQTANGQSTALPTVLRSVSLGGLYMSDVEALILAPDAGEVNLLGESFLKRLVSVEQRNGTLVSAPVGGSRDVNDLRQRGNASIAPKRGRKWQTLRATLSQRRCSSPGLASMRRE